jgi:hypothetical protein
MRPPFQSIGPESGLQALNPRRLLLFATCPRNALGCEAEFPLSQEYGFGRNIAQMMAPPTNATTPSACRLQTTALADRLLHPLECPAFGH